ncbi:AraC family transcriptional regulator [Phaeobacter gallaeciensis]|uniref:AraC family transcriptional regulator n=3 Tax=Roseobacteraceae TaxID=2854170 RepID=A0A366X3T9_9RHOB|nr:AraC family transcriptional regulator [Falsiruegeria litorea]MBT3142844.1 AraC family transcriptional regulator [Falsiruegeria litorea]MBT8168865.1 AraC family transcriptional regulator [Falsiruegeria litorea]RBW57669.1 AraC family transcriptional regulator [Phaeobacter gallaeciensis]
MNNRSDPKFTRAMLVLLPLTTEFAQRGGDVEALLLRHKIPLAALTTPTMLVDASACYAAMEDMAETLGDVHFGAKAATEAANKGAPAIWNAAKNAVTLGDFLARIVVEIATQVDNVRYLFSASADAANFEVQRTLRVSGPTTQLDAIGVVFYVSLIKRGLGKTFDPKHIIVTAPTNAGFPPDFLPKRSFIKSDINGLRISFPPKWLSEPFSPGWDVVETTRGEFARDGSDDGATVAYFRSVLMENIGPEDLSLNRFAEICGTHPRQMQRILSAQGVTYSQMKDEARRHLAVELVANTSTPIAQIALRVGLSGSSALTRAFRQWTGKTPMRFRAEAARDHDK